MISEFYSLKKAGCLVLLLFCLQISVSAQTGVYYLNNGNNKVIWKVKAQADLGADSANMYKAGYATKNWVKAVVPGTVFASYVADGLEKDPNFGDNIYQVDKKKYDRNFWYRTEFSVPDNFNKEKIWLNFKGINRKAEIYLNGKQIGSLNGFMQRGQYDITALLNKSGSNILAVLVYCPKTPLVNYASPTYIPSASWDWMPYVPGLNMGITDDVYLSNTGTLTMHDPWIRTQLPTNARADVSVDVKVKNSSAVFQSGTITGIINPGNISFSQKIFVGGNSTADVKLDSKRFKQLIINGPKLWWPNGYGDPNLYTCKLSVKLGDEVADTKEIKFGIKRYSYDTVGNVLHVSVNGTKIFLKGGNWGMSEYMLRCKGNEYDTKVRFHKEMNFNIIRNWIGSTTDEEFYDACDKYGIMVWDDFWLNSIPNLPDDVNNFNENAVEKIKRFRNHPSIAIWCGDNEGDPMPPINGWLREDISTYDGNDRYYQPNSHAGNLTGSGPWTNFDPRWYFTQYPNGFGGNRGWGLRSEIGTPVFTNLESLKKFIPEDKLWPRNEMWNKHFFGPSAANAGPDRYDEAITKRYGKPTGIADYCRKAQLLNIETNKAMYEGWEDNIWEDASGIMTWMSQSAYPSLVWQTYDYYYDLTGAYWGAKKACEPVHIQWNPVDNSVKVINTTRNDVGGLTASAEVYNSDGSLVKQYSTSKNNIDALSNTALNCFTIAFEEEHENLAKGKPAFASSTTNGEPSLVTDGNSGSRWASNSDDNEWIYIDLETEQTVNGVKLNWEEAFGKEFKIQVSDDAKQWKDVYSGSEGHVGVQQIIFDEVKARYVRMLGQKRGSGWGYSLWDFEVYGGQPKSNGLTDVHFIRLKLTDAAGKLVSDNFYWRGNKRTDFSAINNLPKVNLKVSSTAKKENGKYYIEVKVANPVSSKAAAFAIRVQALNKRTGEQILPAIMSDNYFSLMKGESKTIKIEFDEQLLGKDGIKLLVQPYNDPLAKN
ncbi:discoidin domain-containing protein [Mucilaginibacter segetis]|uniref:Discoidin domain-containing protein n=1 Tax=Mucilaginibacter segetis TaxID=2793071 RepID=A0A934PW95_9SPHI|nr:discoidin domain-containing protein [Mucilaginibacter segetis]MBK0380832.1 discoidin domain-containing protein [Mucilaginibacter segetis]